MGKEKNDKPNKKPPKPKREKKRSKKRKRNPDFPLLRLITSWGNFQERRENYF